MIRMTVITLLCALVVMAFSITMMSCKGKTLFARGSDLPREPGVMYLDSGDGWKTEREAPWNIRLVIPPHNASDFGGGLESNQPCCTIEGESIERKGTITLSGSRVRVGMRLSPIEKANPGFVALFIGSVYLYPLVLKQYGDYQCFLKDEYAGVDKSNLDQGYVYFGINNILSSSTGLYLLTWGTDALVLQRR